MYLKSTESKYWKHYIKLLLFILHDIDFKCFLPISVWFIIIIDLAYEKTISLVQIYIYIYMFTKLCFLLNVTNEKDFYF